MIEWADYVHRLSDERDPSDRMRPFPPTHADVAIRIDTVWTYHFTLHKNTASEPTHRSGNAQAEGRPGRVAASIMSAGSSMGTLERWLGYNANSRSAIRC